MIILPRKGSQIGQRPLKNAGVGRAATFRFLHIAVSVFICFLFISNARAATNFTYKIVAITGQQGVQSIKSAPSINDSGDVAFIGQGAGGENVFIAEGGTLTSLAPDDANRTFSTSFQVNNDGNVVARHSGGNTFSIGFWNAKSARTETIIDSTSGLRQSYCAGGISAGQACLSAFNCVEILPGGGVRYWPCVQPPQTRYIALLFPTVNNGSEVAYIAANLRYNEQRTRNS